MCSSRSETHIPSNMLSPSWATHIPSDMCSPTWEKHVSSDMCSLTWETRIPCDMCSPTYETYIPSDMCPSTWETHFSSDMCFPGLETHIPSDMCYPTCIPKKLTNAFGAKMAFFGGGNISRENVFCDILQQENALLDYKKKKLTKSKNWRFSKGVYPSFWSKNEHF